MSKKFEKATFGAGCFWCVEAIFQGLNGVYKIISGYAGGTLENPTYQEVCKGTTGHAEVVQITFDPSIISYEDLLYVFWRTHDPTTLNRQGADVGTQYRSVIFYHDEAQKALAETSRQEADASDLWPNPIVTEIVPFDNFYPAEIYHRNFYYLNPNQPYCRFVIDPKIQKFRKEFQEKLKQ
jgi:peptide-methionine (S)-S-oxide reductase